MFDPNAQVMRKCFQKWVVCFYFESILTLGALIFSNRPIRRTLMCSCAYMHRCAIVKGIVQYFIYAVQNIWYKPRDTRDGCCCWKNDEMNRWRGNYSPYGMSHCRVSYHSDGMIHWRESYFLTDLSHSSLSYSPQLTSHQRGRYSFDARIR